MKRIISLLLMLVMALSLAACGTSAPAATEAPKAEAPTATEAPATEAPAATEAKGYTVATTADVEKALSDGSAIVLDARLQDSYSGWALGSDARGGHIPGADNFSAFWLTCQYDEEGNLEGKTREEVLADTMANKGISADKNIIVYDTNGTDAVAVCDYLASQGITNLSVYDANEWLNDTAKELESYPRYDMYVPASIVHDIVTGNVPAGFTDAENIVVLDVAWGNNEESGYVDGHVPTAVHVNTDSYEPPIAYVNDIIEWRLADDATLLQLLLDNGITKDSCVIITGYEPMATCRMGVICKYFGVDDVHVMSNGMVGWLSAGYELETGVNEPVPAADFGLTEVPADHTWIDTMDEMKAGLGTEGYTLVDNRTWEEHIGESTGYSYHDIAGRIEGSVFGYAGINSSSSVYYYRNIDKSMRNADEIVAMWEECGLDLNDRLAFMCGSGWRVAEILWDARIMGMDNTCIYSDGWIAWSNEGNPYVTGDPTK